MSSSSPSRIALLSPLVIDQIAAGEVVERPASVVKELVDNAIDAGATRVDVELEEGGLALIAVRDNGRGIHPDDLLLAVTRHATSKLRDPSELSDIGTLGFRGEALASIAAVARLDLRSRQASAAVGHHLHARPGEPPRLTPAGLPVGTQVEVHGLFNNLPARRKFMRAEATEVGQCSEILLRLAIVHPEVHFTLRHGKRELLNLPRGTLEQRVAQVLGRRVSGALFGFVGEEDDTRVQVWLPAPEAAGRGRGGPYLVVRRRVVRERSLSQIVAQAYGLAGEASACLIVEPPRASVDVNVHPQKSEIRFSDPQRVYAAVRRVLTAAMTAAPWTATLAREDGPESAARPAGPPQAIAEMASPRGATRLRAVETELSPGTGAAATELRDGSGMAHVAGGAKIGGAVAELSLGAGAHEHEPSRGAGPRDGAHRHDPSRGAGPRDDAHAHEPSRRTGPRGGASAPELSLGAGLRDGASAPELSLGAGLRGGASPPEPSRGAGPRDGAQARDLARGTGAYEGAPATGLARATGADDALAGAMSRGGSRELSAIEGAELSAGTGPNHDEGDDERSAGARGAEGRRAPASPEELSEGTGATGGPGDAGAAGAGRGAARLGGRSTGVIAALLDNELSAETGGIGAGRSGRGLSPGTGSAGARERPQDAELSARTGASERSGPPADARGGGYRLSTRALAPDYDVHKRGVMAEAAALRPASERAPSPQPDVWSDPRAVDVPDAPTLFAPELLAPPPVDEREADAPQITNERASGPARADLPQLLTCLPGPVAVFAERDALLAVDLRRLRSHLVYLRLQRDIVGRRVVAVQGLLAPAVVRRPREEVLLIVAARAELLKLGVDLDDFGGDAVVVRGVPAHLRHCVDDADVADLIARIVPWLRIRLRETDRSAVERGLLGAIAATRGGDPAPRLARRWLAELLEAGATLSEVPGLRRWSAAALLGEVTGARRSSLGRDDGAAV